MPLVEFLHLCVTGFYQNTPRPQGHEVDGAIHLVVVHLWQEDHLHAPLPARLHHHVGRAAGPGDGEILVDDTQQPHEMHGAVGQIRGDDVHLHVRQHLGDLGDAPGIGAKPMGDGDGPRVQPGRVGALEGALAADAPEYRHAQIREAPGHLALLAGAHRGRGARQDCPLGREEDQVGAKHLVRTRVGPGLHHVHGHLVVPVGLDHGVVFLARPGHVDGRQHLHRVGIVGGLELRPRPVQQDRPQGPPFAVHAAGAPDPAELGAGVPDPRRPALAAVSRQSEGALLLAHGRLSPSITGAGARKRGPNDSTGAKLSRCPPDGLRRVDTLEYSL